MGFCLRCDCVCMKYPEDYNAALERFCSILRYNLLRFLYTLKLYYGGIVLTENSDTIYQYMRQIGK